MRNAALVLGIIAGLWGGMLVGFFGYGYTEFINAFGEIPDLAEQVDHPERIRLFGLIAPPVLAIAGGAMRARSRRWAVVLIASAAGMYFAFGYGGVFTMFPIAMAGLGGILALAARQPDPPH